ncbi:MAG: hypothetical protein MUO50_02735 [Longimicrobiales bacterium]|nr:hypothetical protein [Longimicrobiales bacterium]
MLPNLTELEERILDFMVSYLRTNTYQPSIREIGERFGIKSTKTVSEHLQALADKGFLERDPSRSRGVKILGMDLAGQAVSVPCFARLPEDGKGPRADRAESFLTLDRRLAGEKGAFFVQARSEELAPLGCAEGDYILLEPSHLSELATGAIVAAKLGGGQGITASPEMAKACSSIPWRDGAPPPRWALPRPWCCWARSPVCIGGWIISPPP